MPVQGVMTASILLVSGGGPRATWQSASSKPDSAPACGVDGGSAVIARVDHAQPPSESGLRVLPKGFDVALAAQGVAGDSCWLARSGRARLALAALSAFYRFLFKILTFRAWGGGEQEPGRAPHTLVS